MTELDVLIRWLPSRLAGRIGLIAAAALAAAILTRGPELVAFAAPLLGALATGVLRPASTRMTVQIDPDEPRCFEREEIELAVTITMVPSSSITVRLLPDDSLEVADVTREDLPDGVSVRWRLLVTQWGRFAPQLRISAGTAGGLLAWSDTVAACHIRSYPQAIQMTDSLRATDLPDRIGARIARHTGEGVEFAGIRPYVPGDQLRTVNWPVSARRGKLHVTERLAERSADVIGLIDTYALHAEAGEAGSTGPTREAMGLAVHGTAQLLQAALKRGDRAGVIALGGRLRWLGPDIGRRQFYRVVDAVLDAYPVAGDSDRASAGHTDLVPRGVITSSAIVVAFTPLLDSRIALALHDLRMRGYGVAVIDVLRDIPRFRSDEIDPLVARMWRLERGTMHRNLATIGIPVVSWPDGTTLGEALAPLARRPLKMGRPVA